MERNAGEITSLRVDYWRDFVSSELLERAAAWELAIGNTSGWEQVLKRPDSIGVLVTGRHQSTSNQSRAARLRGSYIPVIYPSEHQEILASFSTD